MKMKVYFSGEVIYDMDKIDAVLSGVAVDNKGGYGDEAIYLPKEFRPSLEVIRDDQLVVEEKETIEVLKKKLRDTEKEKSDEWLKAYNSNKENEKLKEELSGLKKLCPHKEENEPDNK